MSHLVRVFLVAAALAVGGLAGGFALADGSTCDCKPCTCGQACTCPGCKH